MMKKIIEKQMININGKDFEVEYIIPKDMYIITPYVDDDNIQDELLKKFNLSKDYRMNESIPEKTDKRSVAKLRKALIITKINK